MQVQMSFSDAYRIRAKRYVLFGLVFLFLALLSFTFQIQHKNVVFDILGLVFFLLSILSLIHTALNYYRALFVE